jgi:carboxypeptidase PM20D1
MLRTLLRILLGTVFIFIAIILVKTSFFHSRQKKSERATRAPAVTDSSLQHFSRVIQFKTISYEDTAKFDSSQFLGLHRYLQAAYPLVHERLVREVINGYTLMYHWKGSNDTARPVIFLAHLDIVPIESSSLDAWEVNPFSGAIKDGHVWGRGSFDNKVNMVSMLEAAEKLLRQYFQPERSVYFIFGHDEEVHSPQGAGVVARILKARNIRAHLVLDEGGIVTKEKVPGADFPVALLGTAEKGYLTVSLQVEKEGGHSSMPEKETAIDILAKALVKLHNNPFDAKVSLAQEDFINYLGPELPFFKKMIFANAWLFEDLIVRQYEKKPVGNAMMRTTYAATMLSAGVKENIIPGEAKATINLRLLPGDSSHFALARIREVINDERVTVSAVSLVEASGVTPVTGEGYKKVETAVLKTFPNAVVTPFLLVGGTDSKKFTGISDHIIRFTPLIDPYGNHGINERVSIESFRLAMWYYEQLIRDL